MHSASNPRSSFVTPPKKTPSRDLNIKRRRVREPSADFNCTSFATSRSSIVSRNGSFSSLNKRTIMAPMDNWSSLISEDIHLGRFGVIMDAIGELEGLVVQQQQRTGSNSKKEHVSHVKDRLEQIKHLVSQLSEEDTTNEVIINETQSKIQEVYDQGKAMARRASMATLERSELENKMKELNKSHAKQIQTLVDELDRVKSQLKKYQAGASHDDDDESIYIDEASRRKTKDEIAALEYKLSSKEYELAQLKKDFQNEKKELQNQHQHLVSQLQELENELFTYKDKIEKNSAEFELCKQELLD
ncbi:unnamed protein product [Mucor hiemalis]